MEEESIRKSPRPEASPFALDALKQNQKAAFDGVLDRLTRILPLAKSPEDTHHPPWLLEHRESHLVFLSGSRGCGKTSLLLSLIDACERIRLERAPRSQGKLWESAKPRLAALSNRAIWLQPLEMEPLPERTNLLTSILVRIEEAVLDHVGKREEFDAEEVRIDEMQRFSHMWHGVRGEPDTADWRQHVARFKQLQVQVASTWDGHLPERVASIAPEAAATEAVLAEHVRLRLNQTIESFVGAISNAVRQEAEGNGDPAVITDPVFILPIDDFDLNPLRSVELLRLLRLVHVPQLITIMLGDINVVNAITYLKIRGDLALAGSHQPRQLDGTTRPIVGLSGDIASNAVRKLVPPSCRVFVARFTLEDSLGYHPTSRDENCEHTPLRDLAQQIKVRVVTAARVRDRVVESGSDDKFAQRVAGFPVETLHEFLTVKPLGLFKASDREQYLYSASAMLIAPARHIVDLWYGLRELVDSIQEGKNCRASEGTENSRAAEHRGDEGITRVLARWLKAAFEEERWLTPDHHRILKDTLQRDFLGRWNLALDLFSCQESPAAEFLIWEGETKSTRRAFLARQPKGWRILADLRHDGAGEIVNLKDQTAAALVLIHDLFVLRDSGETSSQTHQGNIVRHSLVPSILESPWAAMHWEQDGQVIVEAPWLIPPWPSFWERALLRRSWYAALEHLQDDGHYPASDESQELAILEFLTFVWVTSCCGILHPNGVPSEVHNLALEKTPVNQQGDTPANLLDWDKAVDLLNDLLSEYDNPRVSSRLRRRLVRDWLINLACTLAPERGIPERITARLVTQGFAAFIRANSDRVTKTRLRTLSRPQGEIPEELLRTWLEQDCAINNALATDVTPGNSGKA